MEMANAWTRADASGKDEQGKASIACHSCRKRKVKCDREKPNCRVCVESEQVCKYPLRPLKPGPKIGSMQRPRKRSRGNQAESMDDRESLRSRRRNSYSNRVLGASGDDCSQFQTQDWEERYYDHDEGTTTDQPTTKRRQSCMNMQDLSFILHPSHEVSTPEKEEEVAFEGKQKQKQNQHTLAQHASQALGVSQEMLHLLIRIYFQNMVAINVFHQPTFASKLSNITSSTQLCALLSALLSYAVRFYESTLEVLSPSERQQLNGEQQLNGVQPPGPDHFLSLAFKFIDESLNDCDDEQPPLLILQALIVATHCQLTRGVHGKAWRSLGMCVRIAYELNLHLVDARSSEQMHADELDQHCNRQRDKEEKRRAWWAIWEMDVFASTIRRTPTAIDWGQIETLLPVDDSAWFKDRPAPSTFLESDPVQRWKALQESHNRSPKAWFLVINSLMKDAQIISSPHGVRSQSQQGCSQRQQGVGHRDKAHRDGTVNGARHKLEILANSVQCFVLALPHQLRYRNQYLTFDDHQVPGQRATNQQLHCGIYNIYVMTQLARLMIYRYELFGNGFGPRQTGPLDRLARDSTTQHHLNSVLQDVDNAAARLYFEAADNIFTIINRSSENHIKHINPFLLSTIWLASAVQLVREHYSLPSTSTNLVKSRFDVLNLTYKRCVGFWDSKTAMGQNLEMLERTLEGEPSSELTQRGTLSPDIFQGTHRRSGKSRSSWASDSPEGGTTHKRRDVPSAVTADGHDKYPDTQISIIGPGPSLSQGTEMANRRASVNAQILPNTPPLTILEDDDDPQSLRQKTTDSAAKIPQTGPASFESQTLQRDQLSLQQASGQNIDSLINATLPFPDFAPFFQHDGKHQMLTSDTEMMSLIDGASIINASDEYSLNMSDTQPQIMDWRNINMPLDLQDLLSGYSTY